MELDSAPASAWLCLCSRKEYAVDVIFIKYLLLKLLLFDFSHFNLSVALRKLVWSPPSGMGGQPTAPPLLLVVLPSDSVQSPLHSSWPAPVCSEQDVDISFF